MSEQNNLRKFQDSFPNSHTHHDHEKFENTDSRLHIPFNFFFITISINISATNVKAHEVTEKFCA